MDPSLRQLLQVVEETAVFAYESGDVTGVTAPHSTGWRTLSTLVTAHLTGYDAVVRLESGPNVRAARGEALCVAPSVRHCADMVSREPGVSRWSHTSLRVLDGIDLFSLFAPPMALRGRAAAAVGRINEELAGLFRGEQLGVADLLRRKALGIELAAVVAGAADIRPENLELLRTARRLAPALARVNADLAAPLGRDDLAELVHLSPSRFHALFIASLGVSPGEYVQRRRIAAAQQLLLGTDLSVAEVGRRIGHADQFHFSRLFRSRTGMSPSAFRARTRVAAM